MVNRVSDIPGNVIERLTLPILKSDIARMKKYKGDKQWRALIVEMLSLYEEAHPEAVK